jgi:hypothetical protein
MRTATFPKRMKYEDCNPGMRVVHEAYGPGTIVRPTAGLVQVRPDGLDWDILAIANQLRRVIANQLRAERFEFPVHRGEVARHYLEEAECEIT